MIGNSVWTVLTLAICGAAIHQVNTLSRVGKTPEGDRNCKRILSIISFCGLDQQASVCVALERIIH